MKTLHNMLLLAITFAAPLGVTLAGERVDQRVAAPADGTVTIENLAGSVTVSAWDRDEVRVEGELDERADRLEFENDGNFTRIKVVYPRSMRGNVDGSHLNVSVPAKSRLEVSTVSSEIDVSGVHGPVRAESVSGDISVDSATAEYVLESVSGNVRLDSTRENARIRAGTVSGDVRLGKVHGELDVASISGNVYVSDGTFSRIEAENTSGDIEIGGEFLHDGSFQLEAISGDVTLRFRSEPAGTFDISTFSGGIDNDFGPEPKRTSKYSPGMELEFRQGDAGAEFRLNTLSGDISLRKD